MYKRFPLGNGGKLNYLVYFHFNELIKIIAVFLDLCLFFIINKALVWRKEFSQWTLHKLLWHFLVQIVFKNLLQILFLWILGLWETDAWSSLRTIYGSKIQVHLGFTNSAMGSRAELREYEIWHQTDLGSAMLSLYNSGQMSLFEPQFLFL